MTPIPRKILVVVAFLLGGLALFGLASGVTTSLQRSGPPSASTGAASADGVVTEAKPLETVLPPTAVPDEKAAEEEKKKEEKEEAEAKEEAKPATPAAPPATPAEPPPAALPAPASPPAAPPPPPVESDAGPVLY